MTTQLGKLSSAEKIAVVERAASGETITSIANHFGVTRQAINGILRRRGVGAREAGKLSEAQRRDAVKRYVDGETIAELAVAYGVTQPSIRSLVVLRGVHRPQVHTLRHDAFDLLTEDAKYWIGFLFADGTVHYRAGSKPHVGVGLSAVDYEHLVNLKKFLGCSNAISTAGAKKAAYQFSVRSERLASRLISLGRYAGMIDSDLVASRHFWRGVVDGDGSLGLYPRPGSLGRLMPQFRLVGERRLLHSFRGFLDSHGFKNLSVRPHKSIFTIGTTCNPALHITALLYEGASTALARKAATASRMLLLRHGLPASEETL